MKRPYWIYAVGFVLGVAVGLTYAWIVAPARASGTSPQSLRSDFQDDFRAAIASAYAVTGNLERASARLALLGDVNVVQTLSAQAQRALAAGQSFGSAQELARLASDLQAGISSIPSFTPTVPETRTASLTPTTGPTFATASFPTGSATPTSTIVPTHSPAPTRTAIPSPSAPFQLVSEAESCEPALQEGLLQITVLDRRGDPMPGVEITITSSGGEERFFTGLQPEISAGYADFIMRAATKYSVRVARTGVPISDLAAPVCPGTGEQSHLGGLELTFREP